MSSRGTINTTSFQDKYICTGCGLVQTLDSTQPIICSKCLCRIFRKKYTNHKIQYLAI